MSPTDWPSTPVPDLEDAAFGLTGDVLWPLREAMNQYFGPGASDVTRAGAATAAAAATTAAGVATGDPSATERKPPLFLVAGDALGARLLGWCQVACRSPQWRGLFSKQAAAGGGNGGGGGDGGGVVVSKTVTGKKRPAEDMKVSAAEDKESDVARDTRGVRDEPPGLAKLLCVVSEVVHTVKEHTKILAAARDRVGGVGHFDRRTRDTSGMVQELVGALADAVFDMFRDHLADPSLHRLLLQDAAAAAAVGEPAKEATPPATAVAMSQVAPLVDGASPSEVVGLSVELISDLSWLFSSLEAESTAPVLSSSMACWASGRLLACMPGHRQLEYALGLGVGVGGDAVRPLPARLACFAVRTLLEQLQVAREKDGGDPAATAVPAALRSAARACAGRATASSRVALVTEQMPAWRERQQPAAGAAASHSEEAVAAGRAAATQVLDVLVASLSAAAEHDRPTARPTGSLRRPTSYTTGSIGTLVGPTLQALSELLGEPASASGAKGGGTSTRSSFLTRGKKRRGSPPSGEAGAAAGGEAASRSAEKWTALVGQRLTSCLDRVHVAGMLLAWDSWNPWMEKTATSASTSTPGSLRQTRSWKTYCSLTGQLAKACVSPRPPPPAGQGLASLVSRAVLSFRGAGGRSGDPVSFLDMPAVLLLCKVSVRHREEVRDG